MTRDVTFWYEFASTYSYLSAMEIEERAAQAGVRLVWRPFLLGPIFRDQGLETSPFLVYETKGRNMLRDLERLAEDAGLPFAMPESFPANGLHAARAALAMEEQGLIAPFTRAVYAAGFGRGEDIACRAVLERAIKEAGGDPQAIATRMTAPEIKDRLRANTAEARRLGIFGAPSFTFGSELFWGHDRLDQALRWARR